ncbi:MAG TPA: class I SAM-dependent methyltransferase [Aestuariivirga sp.]|nr:class I SAM-dependent methyltransferase [Aestuariivirga sp.]
MVREIQSITGRAKGTVLLLGVTPELADAFDEVFAVDKNPSMIANVWPGDSAGKRAVAADWLELSSQEGTFAAIVGDGSLNNLGYPSDIKKLLGIALEMLAPGGRFVCRLFERPSSPFTIDDIMLAARAPDLINFHALKWMIAMHIAARNNAMVPVAQILATFNKLFPDRERLSGDTEWPRAAIDTIDVYQDSTMSYSFPCREEFLAIIPDSAIEVEFRSSGTYNLASCCPILAFRKP